jgi:DNA polymerase sigma
VKPRRNRNGQRQYEEKPTFATEAINNENNANKAAYSAFNKLLESKLCQLAEQNNSIHEIKTYSYQLLHMFFAQTRPDFAVNIFGSLAAGVSLPNSDIDILLTPLFM